MRTVLALKTGIRADDADNIINQTVLKRQINKAGLTCDGQVIQCALQGNVLTLAVADNGLIALNLIHEAHRQSKRAGPARKKLYDCVLMDLEMPGKSKSPFPAPTYQRVSADG